MNLVLIQARMGSTRLPGKVLKEIMGVPLLLWLYKRITPSRFASRVVVATTMEIGDDPIVKFCIENKIEYYRGSEWDVLDRYYQAAKFYHATNIIRVTADCPLQHHSVIDFIFEQFEKSGCDYFSNSNCEPDFLEDGFDVEIFNYHALEVAWLESKLLSEREHVTPYIKYSGKFNCGWKKFLSDYHFKLSVDSPEDFLLVDKIFNHLKSIPEFGMNEVIDLLNNYPELIQINHNSIINSGYKLSLKMDKTVNP